MQSFHIALPEAFKDVVLFRTHDWVDSIVVSDEGIVKVYPKFWFVGSGVLFLFSENGSGVFLDHKVVIVVKSWFMGRIDVSDGKLAKAEYKPGDKIVFYFQIESVESFEKQLKEAQQAQGIDPSNCVPVRREKWFHRVMWSFCWKIIPSVGGTLYAFLKITRRI